MRMARPITAEIGALAAAGGDKLVIIVYVDRGGSAILREASNPGAFDSFHLPAGMMAEALEQNFGTEVEGTSGQHPGTDSPGAARYAKSLQLLGQVFRPGFAGATGWGRCPHTPGIFSARRREAQPQVG